ncbi:MAG: hypothetical protein ACTSXJ_09005 [Candidatus Baldrarchaeia archaeon]
MAKEKAQDIGSRIAISLPIRSDFAIINDEGEVLYSNLSPQALETAKKIVKSSLPVWDIGDYQIKTLGESHLLIYKVTEKLAFALDSQEAEGIMIVIAKRLASLLNSEFKELESLMIGAPVEVKEVTVPRAPPPPPPEKAVPEEVHVVEEKPAPPRVEVEPANYPILTDRTILKKIKDETVRKMLELCDGDHTVKDIAEELGLPRARVLITLGEYSSKGLVTYISGIRKMELLKGM